MSKLGFDRSIKQIERANRIFLQRGIRASMQEFKRNFDREMNSETGQGWEAVLRAYPPPILDVTGELRAQALSAGNVRYYGYKAVLTADPIDERGRGYASYHMDGTPNMTKREFFTQSESLTKEHLSILADVQDRIVFQ